MERLDATAVRALRLLLDTQPTTEAKVRFAWRVAAGPSVAQATELVWSPDGTLRVRARSENWRREVARAVPMLAARLADLLGRGVVKRITVLGVEGR